MAFSKYANANIIKPDINVPVWDRVLNSSGTVLGTAFADRQASKIALAQYNPKDYMLSHCTIVASVDTENGPGQLGQQMAGSDVIDRKYQDYYITPNTSQFVNNNCFVPGTLITMADGTVKPIESIEVGDEVLSHTGKPRRVRDVTSHEVSEDVLRIQSRGTTERLTVTKDHPFFVFRHQQRCVSCGKDIQRNLRCISHPLGRHYCSRECYYDHKVSNEELLANKQGAFIEAGALTTSDYVSFPVPSGSQDVPLTLKQARLVGLFLAEGYYELDSRRGNEKVGVCWAFHEDKANTLADFVIEALASEFGASAVVRTHSRDHGIHVTSRVNRDLVTFFSTWVRGSTSQEKTLHPDLLEAPVATQLEVLKGWFEGDGCLHITKTDMRLSATSASRSLVSQAQILLHRAGVSSHLTFSEASARVRKVANGAVCIETDPSRTLASWTLSCGEGGAASLAEGTYYETAFRETRSGKKAVQSTPALRYLNGYHLQKVSKIEEVPYAGKVYNFDVEVDHSYIANGVAVHNCDSWERKLLLSSFRTFVGGENYVEHLQIPEMSKGKIIDAAARDIGDSVYIDILVATHRKFKPLVASIQKGDLSTLSMGCFVGFTICSQCGNVAVDETQLCTHIKYAKGNNFIDELGKTRKIAELCFPPGVRVTSGAGLPVAISDLQVGDVVLTHKGRRRQVTQLFERHYEGNLTSLTVEGLPHVALASTPNHPYYVCPAGSLSEFEFKEAQDLRKGDRLLLPIPQETYEPDDVNPERAELLGWFLAEGSYLKKNGSSVGVQFTLNAEDEGPVAERLASLLKAEFEPELTHTSIKERWARVRKGYEPSLNSTDNALRALEDGPSLARQVADRSGVRLLTVNSILNRYEKAGVVSSRTLEKDEFPEIIGRRRSRTKVWALVEGAPVTSLRHVTVREDKHQTRPSSSRAKRYVHPRVHNFPREGAPGRKLVVVYVNKAASEWFYKHAHEYSESKRLSQEAILWPTYLQIPLLKAYVHGGGHCDSIGRHSVSSISDSLVTQMQLIAARCGMWTRRQLMFEGKASHVQMVNGPTIGFDGCRPRHELSFQPSPETTNFFDFGRSHLRGIGPKRRRHGEYLAYAIRSTTQIPYSGPVHNISVEDDESYLVENMAVHNCGHIENEPGSVKFIEASWVANPAFTGAVLRNILSPEEAQVYNAIHKDKIAVAMTSPARAADPSMMSRAARSVQPNSFEPKLGFEFGQEEQFDGADTKDQAADPMEDAISDTANYIRDKALRRLREQMSEKNVPNNLDENENDTLIKQASGSTKWRKIASLVLKKVGGDPSKARRILLGLIHHKKGGWRSVSASSEKFSSAEVLAISRVLDALEGLPEIAGEARIYRTVLAVGGSAPYGNEESYLAACGRVLGRQPTHTEAQTLIVKGKLFDLGR